MIWCCNLKAEDVNIVPCTNSFWKDVLKAWCLYHFSEEVVSSDEIIWYNSNIKV